MITNSSIVDVRVDLPSATVVLNRPSLKNALSSESIKLLLQSFSDLHQEKNVAAVILTGYGDSFCAGTDLKDLSSKLKDEGAHAKWHEETMSMKELVEVMLRFPKPIIAAVNGPAFGFGFALALACDLVIASPAAQFGCPEIKRGLVPGLVSPLLSFRVGAGKAAGYAISGQTVPSEEAITAGFCHEVVAHGDVLWARAHEIAKEMSANSPQAVQMTKTLINETMGEELFSGLNNGTAVSAAARTTESAREGVAAFTEKRNPNWL